VISTTRNYPNEEDFSVYEFNMAYSSITPFPFMAGIYQTLFSLLSENISSEEVASEIVSLINNNYDVQYNIDHSSNSLAILVDEHDASIADGTIQKYTQSVNIESIYYTITWKNYDGTILEIDNNVSPGTIPTYDGKTPEREKDSEHIYNFNGWTPTILVVEEDVIYTALYTETSIVPNIEYFIFIYIERTDSYQVIGFLSRVSAIEIPTIYNSKNVTSIGDYVFYNNTSLENVIIPNSITSIGYSTFEGCSSLTNITFPDNLISIGGSSFKGCSSLTSVIIPENVTSIGNNAFAGCNSINNIEIHPNNKKYYLLTLGNGKVVTNTTTWRNDSYVEGSLAYGDIIIPSNVTYIARTAFSGCSSIKSVVIPDSIKSIGDSAFSGCSSLTSIIIPIGVISIGGKAFEECSLLTIYCMVSSEPANWNSNWNSSNRPVVWGYTKE
jgi:hypothetical protein